MGTRSRTPRSGQDCGIGIRTTRSLGTSFTSTPSWSNALISPVSTSPPSCSETVHKKQAIAPSSRRDSGGKASGKTATSPHRPHLARAPQGQLRRPELEEEILAEIIVSTDDLDELESMSENYSEVLETPAAFVGPELDVLQHAHETASSIVTSAKELTPQPPSVEPESIDTSSRDEQTIEPSAGNDASEALTPVGEGVVEPVSPKVMAEDTAVEGPSLSIHPRLAEPDPVAQPPLVTEPDEQTRTATMDVDGEFSASDDTMQVDSVSSGAPAVLSPLPTGQDISKTDPNLLGSAFESAIGRTEPPRRLAPSEGVPLEHAEGAMYTQPSHADGGVPVKEAEDVQTRLEAPKVASATAAAEAEEAQISCSASEQSEPMDLDPEASPPGSIEAPRSTDVVSSDRSPEALEAPLHETLAKDAQPQKADLTSTKPTESELATLEPEIVKSEPVDGTFQAVPESTSGSAEVRVNGHQSGYSSVPSSNTANVNRVPDGATDQPSESELSEISTAGDPNSTEASRLDPTPAKSALSHLIGQFRHSFASSASALTERSGLSSKPSSVSSKATTPLDTDSPREATGQFGPAQTFPTQSAPRIQFNVQPKVSVPADLTPQEYAMECIEAAENSRLNPYALHQDEYHMLRSHISHAQVTTYLNIRNGILRLWVRNPQIAVTREEAIGCAKDIRWFDVANVCFDWLVRRGFINYGCVEVRQAKVTHSAQPQKRRRTVAVIGAGFSGLSAARQLEGLFLQYSKRFRDMGEEPPRVIVLEGRNRVGGRVYSRAFQSLPDTAPGVMRGKRFTAEMGGMIITGFDRGNPLNILVRGQLGLPYHCLRSDMSLYDANGTAVDPGRDQLVEQLFNACLDRVSEYKFKPPPSKLIEGNRDLMDEGRDSTAEGHKTIALVEEMTAAQPHAPSVSEQNVAPQVNLVPVSTDRMTGKVHVEPGTPGSTKAAFKVKSLGWPLKAGVSESRDIELDATASNAKATLGSVVDEALMQHKNILDLNAQDFRLLNWHIANLEYSNATNLNRLSIKGWDIDAGNEWEGKHTMVVGGYQSVARGIAMLPAPLNIQHRAAVKRIKYAPEGSTGPARITLEDGHMIQADYIVNTIPLGVLKHGNIEFQPPLPSWKTEAIQRLGFGVLNKVILVYKEAFWDKDRDIFGMLQTPTNRLSLNQKDYAPRRGRFFQWFNVTNTTGMPCLLALMAGDAGYDTEITPNDELIAEATEVLRMRYGARVTQPLEAIVTRWESDRFARGSYSNAGVNMKAEDYQLMARTIGNLYFAGEHTTVTHPATVHGAYLSGLRAASEVLDAILGPIEIPSPLILPRETTTSLKRKAQNRDPARARLEAYEMEITEHIQSKIGYYPLKPAKVAGNAYLLFNKVHYEDGRKRCEEGRRADKGKPSPNEVRTMTSKMWKEAAPEVRKPFEDQADEQKKAYAQALKDWTEATARWEKDAIALREKYVREHPSVPGPEEVAGSVSMNGNRRVKRVESYREDDSDVDLE